MSLLRGIQAVCFDVGGTLIDVWPSVGHVYASVAAEMGLPTCDPVQLSARFGEAWCAKKRFNYTRRDWAGLVVCTFGGSPEEFGLDSPFFERLYERFIQSGSWKVHDDVLPTLEFLSSRGLRLAVISNWDDRLRPLLRNLNLDAFFDRIEVSGETGFHKPSPLIFQRALSALGVDPGSALHVGDSWAEDVEGARAAGLHALLLKRSGPADRRAHIHSLSELKHWLYGP